MKEIDVEQVKVTLHEGIREELSKYLGSKVTMDTIEAVRTTLTGFLQDLRVRGMIRSDLPPLLVDVQHQMELQHLDEQVKELEKEQSSAIELGDLHGAMTLRSAIDSTRWKIQHLLRQCQDPNKLVVVFKDPETWEERDPLSYIFPGR